MAGKGVATWVKVKTKSGFTSRPISHKYEGGTSFESGQVITMSEYQKLKAEGNQKRGEGKAIASIKKTPDTQKDKAIASIKKTPDTQEDIYRQINRDSAATNAKIGRAVTMQQREIARLNEETKRVGKEFERTGNGPTASEFFAKELKKIDVKFQTLHTKYQLDHREAVKRIQNKELDKWDKAEIKTIIDTLRSNIPDIEQYPSGKKVLDQAKKLLGDSYR